MRTRLPCALRRVTTIDLLLGAWKMHGNTVWVYAY